AGALPAQAGIRALRVSTTARGWSTGGGLGGLPLLLHAQRGDGEDGGGNHVEGGPRLSVEVDGDDRVEEEGHPAEHHRPDLRLARSGSEGPERRDGADDEAEEGVVPVREVREGEEEERGGGEGGGSIHGRLVQSGRLIPAGS